MAQEAPQSLGRFIPCNIAIVASCWYSSCVVVLVSIMSGYNNNITANTDVYLTPLREGGGWK